MQNDTFNLFFNKFIYFKFFIAFAGDLNALSQKIIFKDF